jgi:DNA-binding response OmpR family regulator
MQLPDLLVVEDDPELNEIVGVYASLAGFNYRPALDGQTALAEVDRQPPAAIVLDLMLPDMSGFDVCRRVCQMCQGYSIPVIILTALDSPESRQRGIDSGAAAYLTKPFDPEVLLQTLVYHTQQPRNGSGAHRATGNADMK